MLHKFSYIFVIIISALVFFSIPGLCQSNDSNINEQIAQTQKKYNIDPSIPLSRRIRETSPDILKKFRDAGMSPTLHKLSSADSMKMVFAFQSLPPLHQRVLKEHLQGISFLDNMPNTALTATVNPDDPFPVFTITFRAEILKQNVSEWLTEKELSCFINDNPNLKLSIEAGTLDAILYVLLHEATHVVDGSLNMVQRGFANGKWVDRIVMAPKYQDSLSNQIRYRRGGKPLSIGLAKQVYKLAAQKPFASLYSTSSWHEDLAEYLTIYHFTRKLKQPFRIVIHDHGKEIFSYKPMQSKLVRSRLAFMAPFYAH